MDVMWGKAYSATRVYEGGYVDHPKDPGGATNYGVTQRVYDGYRRGNGLPKRSVREIAQSEVQAIYRKQYWDAVRGDELPGGLDFALFDGAINSGPVQSIKWLQRALQAMSLYAGRIDGLLGDGTLDAVRQVANVDRLIAAVCERRLAFCRALKTWSTFGKGWSARIAAVKKNGQAWAVGDVGEQPFWVEGMQGKAVIEDAKPLPATSPADATAAVGGTLTTGGGGALGFVNSATDKLSAFAGTVPYVNEALVGLTVVGLFLTVGGAAYSYYARSKAKERSDALDFASGVAA